MSQAVWRVSVVAWLQGTGLQVYIICREYTPQERDTDSGSLVCLQTVLLPWKGSNIWKAQAENGHKVVGPML